MQSPAEQSKEHGQNGRHFTVIESPVKIRGACGRIRHMRREFGGEDMTLRTVLEGMLEKTL